MNSKEKSDAQLLKNEVAQREITQLIHFTPALNLLSIFEQGAILSRQRLDSTSEITPDLHMEDYLEINDERRYDNRLDCINTSIQRPNSYLLRNFRNKTNTAKEHFVWCIISLKPDLIWREGTVFSISNAASTFSKQQGFKEGHEHFSKLFQENLTTAKGTFRRTRLDDAYPTDIQAEVLIPDGICVSNIQKVYFENEDDLHSIKAGIKVLYEGPLPEFIVDPSMFY